MNFRHVKPVFAAILAIAAFLTASCDLGEPIRTSGPTEVEGLTGTLVTPSGAPAAGAWVKAYAAPANALGKGAAWTTTGAVSGPALDSVQTGSDGSFNLAELGDGVYNLAARARWNDTTLALFLRDIVVSGRTPLGVDTLKVSGEFVVRLSAGGEPLAGALCFIAGSPWSTVSDAEGNCIFTEVPPGEFRVSVSYSGSVAVDVGDVSVPPGGEDPDTLSVPLPEDTPNAPGQRFPGHGATGVTLIPNISWTRVADAAFYTLLLSTDSTFATGTVTYGVPQPALPDTVLPDTLVWRQTDSLQENTTYFWKVRAVNGAGESPYSPVRRFTTRLIDPPPTMPLLVIPTQGATGTSTSPILAWTAVPGAAHYQVQVATDSAFLSGMRINDSAGADTTFVAAALNEGTTYFWRVRGLSGSWSSTRHFTTGGVLLAPVQILPGPGAIVNYGATVLRWGAVSDATHYRLQLAKDATFALPVLDTVMADTSRLLSLEEGTTYFWRVRSENASGQGAFTATRQFTTTTFADSLNSGLQLFFPAYGQTEVPTPTLLVWSRVGGATGYQIQLATDSVFTAGLRDTVVADTSTTVSLAGGTWYFWRVRVVANGQTPGWRALSAFSTAGP